ncbi:MAG: hypothetical protein N4A74_23865 [Carboxylicivirga sp.]|jgi:hypothetical protein|nr:hypothetical protein [Carboxylicivirga sp.]
MRRVLLFLALIISVQINGWSQNITGYEYWIDDDANISKQSVTGAPQYNFDQLIDLSALKDGLHVFNIRFEDNKGQWSSLLSRFFYKNPVATSENSNIVSYEYWLDSDYANKVSQTVTAVPQIVVGEQLDYASLKEGLHLFNIRFKDSQGVWSSLLTRFFYKSALDNSGSVQIVEYEYWFDDDYVQVVNKSITSTSQLSVNESFDFSDLSSGLHSFNIRVKDNLGKWSSPLTQFIYKKPVEFSGSKEITNYQYWLNDNFENAKTIAVANSSSVELIENHDFSALLAGTHQL